jgi:hypothetical protein
MAMRALLLAVVGSTIGMAAAWGQPPTLPPGTAPLNLPPGPAAATAQAAPGPVEMTIIARDGVEVRSGPTMAYNPTSKLRFGDKVIVLRESKDQPDWYEIVPPAGSFSWINGKYVKTTSDQRIGVIDADATGATVLAGSSLVNKEPSNESRVKLASGFQVTILDRPMTVNGQNWYLIAPPPNDVRYLPKEAVTAPATANVTPPNWMRGPDGAAPGQLTGAGGAGPVATPASLRQPASPWTQNGTAAAQPAQWSSWGKLRRTAFAGNDGQPMYVLEDRNGQVLLYVSSTPGTSLRNYIDRTVCLYGTIAYHAGSYPRTHIMTASHVATP